MPLKRLVLGLILSSLCSHAQVRISTVTDEGQEAFKIETPAATYYYQKNAGGFSSIVDPSGQDWLGFKTEPKNTFPTSAASDYRGLPNMVFQGEDGGAGHPGFSPCVSAQQGENSILTETKSGKWKWQWTFTATEAHLKILQVDPARNYWFLYEGTPGGSYSPSSNLWGTNKDGLRSDQPDFIQTEGTFENWNWVYFGDKNSRYTLYIKQHSKDELLDMMGYMGNTKEGLSSPDGMVVFGFGRGPKTKALFSRPQEFTVGFLAQNAGKKNTFKKLKKRLN